MDLGTLGSRQAVQPTRRSPLHTRSPLDQPWSKSDLLRTVAAMHGLRESYTGHPNHVS